MLDSSHQLTTYDSAPNGHVALTAGVRLPGDGTTTLALGFGTTRARPWRPPALRFAGRLPGC